MTPTTPKILQASAVGDLEAIRDALARDVDIDTRDDAGNTPLHIASLRDSINAVRFLLDHGADVNAVNLAGDSPLTLAAGRSSRELILLLHAAGADMENQNDSGKTAHEIATLSGNEAFFEAIGFDDSFVDDEDFG